MIRILVADDHAILRDGLKQILANRDDMAVTGEAADGGEVLTRIRTGEWDVLVLDMSMPGRSGIELIKQVKAEKPKLPILILSMHKEDQYAVRTLRAGASGYLCKDGASQQLVDAIRRVAGGGKFISPEVAESLAFELSSPHRVSSHAELSDREFQVFRLIAEGRGVTEIAERLSLSVKTVSTHKTRLLQKMKFDNSADLVRYALEHGLLDDRPETPAD